MANALYKLWTSNITYVTLHYSLRQKIIHRCQEGGILGRDTRRQLRNHINIFEDAFHTKKDLYCLYIDFKNAFNMVDHDKLFCIMYDLGIPTDIIEVIKNIYTDNRTIINLPGGKCEPLTLSRGTVQGDPLSPILFIMYIEPLLRWLHVGGRGYKYGCLRGKTDPHTSLPLDTIHAHAASGFIDDTAAYTHTRDDMEKQARKIDAYSKWAGLPISHDKCAITAILHGEAAKTGRGTPINPERLASLLDHGAALRIGDQPIPFKPPTETYKYLGVHTCPTMLWTKQLTDTLERVEAMGSKLARSLASPRQCLQIIKRVIKPVITYGLCVAPYTMQQLHQLDRALARIVRACSKLGRSFPTAGILKDEEAAGWGLISLTVDYAQISTSCLVRSISDEDRLGTVTDALLDLQKHSKRGNAAVEELMDDETRFYTSLRQLRIMERCGISLTKQGEVYECTPPEPTHVCEADRQLSALLRAQSPATWALFNPLQRVGVKHLGELINTAGTHFITSTDLERTYGMKVTAREKRALNQLSVSISGVLPVGIKSIGKVRDTGPLDLYCRALPGQLALPPRDSHAAIRQATGTHDIRDLFSASQNGPSQGRPQPLRVRRTTTPFPQQPPVVNGTNTQISEDKLPAHIREGRSDRPIGLNLKWEKTKLVRESVHLDPTERNPDRDIDPPLQYLIQLGRRCPESPVDGEDTAFIYQPDGRCVGTLTKECLTRLHAQYEEARRAPTSRHREQGTTFAQDVAKLLLRHRAMQGQCGLISPDVLMKALKYTLGPFTERFASPMDRSPHSHSFWSALDEDGLFGANHNAYSSLWTGLSQAFPGTSDEACEKAMRWAIASASTRPDEPTCTVLLLPNLPGRPHMKHLQYGNIKILGILPNTIAHPAHIPKHGDCWKLPHVLAPKPTHGILVVAIHNTPGEALWLTPERISALKTVWDPPSDTPLPPRPDPTATPYLPKAPRAVTALHQAQPLGRVPTPSCSDETHGPPVPPFTCARPLCAPAGGVYTDGSCIKIEGQQRVGAAVYFTKSRITLLINPNGKNYTNTITRAEISAIHQAIAHTLDCDEPLHIYTDSLCAIHMIRRILDAPWTLRESKHYHLLNKILDALLTKAERGSHTYIYKVKSHSGVEANGIADKKAKSAALNPEQEGIIIEETENDPYGQRTWACLNKGRTDPSDPPLRYLPSLCDGVKRAVTTALSGGLATSGFYTEAWTKAMQSMHKPSNARMWKDKSIAWRQQKRTMQGRWGTLPNQKLAHRYKLADSPNCPLCNRMDSVGHLLGGCEHPEARGNKILRHDGAVKLILHAIAKGPKGGFYKIMDAGKENDLTSDIAGKRVRPWLFPRIDENLTAQEKRAEAARRRKLRPDILVIEGLETANIRGKSTEEIRLYLTDNRHRLKVHILGGILRRP